MTQSLSRSFDFRFALGLPLLMMALLVVFEPHRLDFALAHLFYQPGEGFIGRHSFLLESILHTKVKQLLIGFGLCALAGFVLSLFIARLKPWRRDLSYLVLALTLCSSIVTPLKAATNVHCPWSLQVFGGDQQFRPLLGKTIESNKPGRCWPAGHASAGFSWLALFSLLRDRYPRSARVALVGALALGSLLASGRMMQGAHFFSHSLWTLLLDWVIGVLAYRLLLYRPPAAAEPLASAPTSSY
ncbi:phosphoesterase [Ventosimonas gracilis]|uniref:Phosphoesterase n=1 Tax=Ventosimonas gracilis TaxID=1680762 RepID=A0A139SVB6_9GAMM|nr:phosphatase PAP2 family protein [Ventosimonas gracilis]KXU38509.1 phosphoesterase [Ventosimonas gracilis]